KRVFRGGRCFELWSREISDRRDYLPCCSLWNHRNCRRSLWPTFHTRSAPAGTVLGWLLLFAAAIFSLIIAGIAVNRRLSRILIVDDTRITRQQIRALLQDIAEWDVCGEAIDGLDAIAKTRELAPDV